MRSSRPVFLSVHHNLTTGRRTHLGVLYNPPDDPTPDHHLWSAFEVLCFIEHVNGQQLLLLIMKQCNLPYPLARDEPSPFNFWTFATQCDDAHLVFDTLS